ISAPTVMPLPLNLVCAFADRSASQARELEPTTLVRQSSTLACSASLELESLESEDEDDDDSANPSGSSLAFSNAASALLWSFDVSTAFALLEPPPHAASAPTTNTATSGTRTSLRIRAPYAKRAGPKADPFDEWSEKDGLEVVHAAGHATRHGGLLLGL